MWIRKNLCDFPQPFATRVVPHLRKHSTLSAQQHNTMKALLNTIIASALLSAAYAQAPEGKEKKGPHGPPPKEILEKFDKDGDGKLNDEEAAAARTAMQAKRAEMEAKFDKDGDGKLSDEEKKAMMEERKAEMLKRFDKDGDGTLSDEEKKAMREAIGEHRPKKPRPGGPKKGE
jgi:hypothetical protein